MEVTVGYNASLVADYRNLESSLFLLYRDVREQYHELRVGASLFVRDFPDLVWNTTAEQIALQAWGRTANFGLQSVASREVWVDAAGLEHYKAVAMEYAVDTKSTDYQTQKAAHLYRSISHSGYQHYSACSEVLLPFDFRFQGMSMRRAHIGVGWMRLE